MPAVLIAVMPTVAARAEPSAAPSGRALMGVTCPRVTSCWAVGAQLSSGATRTLTEHWNGSKWSLTVLREPAPLPMGTISDLPDVSCATSVNCFAVGFANNQTLIEQRRGSKWVRVKSPNPAGAQVGLSGVFCLSSHACWAVGVSIKQDGTNIPLAEHWNGRRWSIVRTP